MSFFDLFAGSQRPVDSGRLLRIEKKLDLILNHLGLEFQPFSDEVCRAVDSGNKILAIKLYREETGLGLAQAKKDVEAYMNTWH